MNTIFCQICRRDCETSRRSVTRYCDDCYSKRSWYTWGRTERGKMMRAKRFRELRETVFNGYGNKCDCCGETSYEFLAADHVNGGGRKDRQVRNTRQILKDTLVRNFPSEYRVLCHNCNQSLGWYGYCPHNRKRTA